MFLERRVATKIMKRKESNGGVLLELLVQFQGSGKRWDIKSSQLCSGCRIILITNNPAAGLTAHKARQHS